MQYEKNYRRLKSLDERGAESSTIDSTRLTVRLLRSKISINVRTANAFSSKIQKIRDEELYPQLVDLIQRYEYSFFELSGLQKIKSILMQYGCLFQSTGSEDCGKGFWNAMRSSYWPYMTAKLTS
jgi:hypothetical protein